MTPRTREPLAVVTGAASGIGRATALALAHRGSDLVLLDLDSAGLESLKTKIESLGREVLAQRVDVSAAAEVARSFEAVTQIFGPRLEILVNCAGIVYVGPVAEMNEEDWDRVIAVNLKSVFLCCKTAIPLMRRAGWGRIVNVSSVGARTGGIITGANYAASKGGVWSFSKALARELAGDGITVNCIMPGVIDTPMTQGHDPSRMEAIAQAVPLGRLGRPEDVAQAIVFLASQEASYITGATLDVNGGLRMD
jgi:3-oxoacyl-[acyl-carrier protein] reductase